MIREKPGEESAPRWWVPLLLAIPALIPLAASVVVAHRAGGVPTGFIQYDQPFYIANAREHFNQGFHLLYSNPYAGYDTPAIYFQPQIFLLGCLQQLGMDPGITYNLFGLAALLFAACVAVRFYREVVGWHSPGARLGLLCFFWGGGALTLAGLAYSATVGKLSHATVLHFDALNGWWMLNFGRNLIYPTEAYYHAVVLLSMLYLLRRRIWIALGFTALVSISHPFTGLDAVLILAAYLAVERMLGDKSIRLMHLIASTALVIFHLGYYRVYLNHFADHRILSLQMEQEGKSWVYRPETFLPALFLVGLLAAACLTRWPGWRQHLSEPRNRLFLTWFLVVFAVTQHDLILKPVIPVHFAHGYDWMALFFLSAPLLVAILDRLLAIGRPPLRMVAVSAVMLFFLSDNLFWFGTSFLWPHIMEADAITLTHSEKEVLDWLAGVATPPDMVVCANARVSYLVSTYTKVRSWKGHLSHTPSYDERALQISQAFQNGTILPVWKTMRVFYVASHDETGWIPPPNAIMAYRNAQFDVWECPPSIKTAGVAPEPLN